MTRAGGTAAGDAGGHASGVGGPTLTSVASRACSSASDCFICAKHRDLGSLPGGAIAGDASAIVSHLPLATPGTVAATVYLGYLMVESRRHAAGWGDLSDAEAASIGRLAARASAALRVSEGAEHIYSAVIGHGVDHFHLHLIPRYPSTPREYWWARVDEWPDAPRGDAAAISALAERLRSVLAHG